MPTIDLNPYQPEPLTLTIGDRDWVIPPPSAEDGLTLAGVITIATGAELGASLADMPAHVVERLRDHAGEDLADLALSPTVHANMIAAGLSSPMIDRATQAAAFYWVTGSTDAAVAVLDATHGAGTMPRGVEAPKDSPHQRTGHHTGSGTRTRTGSTPTTGPRQSGSGHKPQGKSKKKRSRPGR